jgi:phosphatidylserine decarboxylase
VVSPADGRVSLITTAVPPAGARPAAGADDPGLGVHERVRLPREPLAGHGPDPQILYTPGLFLNAELDKASEDNERNALVIETAGRPDRRGADRRPRGAPHRVLRQGGRHLGVGERFGLIRFGSRLDIYLPLDTQVLVGLGQMAIAGETVLADLKANEPARQYRVG